MPNPRNFTLQAHMERRFLREGRKAHVISTLSTSGSIDATAPYATALCGRQPALFTGWLGSGSYTEEERAAALPLCRLCAEQVARANYLREVWGPMNRVAKDRFVHVALDGRCRSDGLPWPCKYHLAAPAGHAPAEAR